MNWLMVYNVAALLFSILLLIIMTGIQVMLRKPEVISEITSRILVSESESEWLYSIVDTLRKGQANLLMRSCTEAM